MVEERLKKLDEWIIRRVLREKNRKVNVLARIVAILLINRTIMLPIYHKIAFSIIFGLVCSIEQTYSGWMLEIIKYLQIGDVPKDRK